VSGDHVVVVGRVSALTANDLMGRPLTFCRGACGRAI
jgi:hypothetical protein